MIKWTEATWYKRQNPGTEKADLSSSPGAAASYPCGLNFSEPRFPYLWNRLVREERGRHSVTPRALPSFCSLSGSHDVTGPPRSQVCSSFTETGEKQPLKYGFLFKFTFRLHGRMESGQNLDSNAEVRRPPRWERTVGNGGQNWIWDLETLPPLGNRGLYGQRSVLVNSGRHNKTPLAGRLKQWTCICSQFLRPEVQGWGAGHFNFGFSSCLVDR